MIILTNAKDNRKDLIKTLSEVLHEKPHYCGAPSFAYEFSLCRVDREAAIRLAPTIVRSSAESAAALLNQRGFGAKIVEEEAEVESPTEQPEEVQPSEQHYTVHISSDQISTETLTKLEAIIAGKATLLRNALGASKLSIIPNEQGYAFPWFQIESNADEQNAYHVLIEKLIDFARERTRVTASDKETDNPKYAFRCFLLRLGFIGAEYKRERAILLRNLEGNGAFKSGSDPRKNPA